MPKVLKIVVGALVAVIALGTIGLIALRDMDRRPDYCASCHVTDQGVASWVDSDYLAYQHAVSGVACQRCHERSVKTVVQEVVSTVTQHTTTPPAGFQFASADCIRCHGDYDRLAAATSNLPRNPHASPHGKQECTDCHKVHGASVDTCAECHEPMIAGPGWTTPPQASAPAKPGN